MNDAAINKHITLLTCTAGILQLKYIKLQSCSMRAKLFSVYLFIYFKSSGTGNNDENANNWLSMLILKFYVEFIIQCCFCDFAVKEKYIYNYYFLYIYTHTYSLNLYIIFLNNTLSFLVIHTESYLSL